MRWLKFKFEKSLKNSICCELEKLKYKFVFYNCKFPFFLRQEAYLDLYKESFNKFSSEVRYRCLLSNKARSVYTFFKLSRIQVKYLLYSNSLVGIKKKSF